VAKHHFVLVLLLLGTSGCCCWGCSRRAAGIMIQCFVVLGVVVGVLALVLAADEQLAE
jgi:hypothetical protein